MKTLLNKLITVSIIIAFTIMAFVVGFSCRKKTEPTPEPEPTPTGNTTNINAFFTANSTPATGFTVSATTNQTITGTRAVISIPANAFVTKATGSAITGTVQIWLKEMYTKKDMILNQAQTMTANNILTSTGEMNLVVKQGNTDLKLAPGKQLGIKILEPVAVQPSMMVFNGALNANQQLVWTVSPSTPSVATSFDSTTVGTGFYYNFNCDSLGWINCDALYCSACPVTSYTVNLPGNHDKTNTSVFVAYTSINGAGHLWPSSTNAQLYPQTLYVSASTPMVIVAISEINGQYYSAFQSTTPTNGAVYNLTLTATTNAAILTALNSL